MTMIFQDPMNSLNPVLKCGDQLSEVYLLHQKEFLKAELDNARQENSVLKAKLKQMKGDLKTCSVEGIETLKKQIVAIKSRIQGRISLKDIANRESAKLLDRIGLPNAEDLLNAFATGHGGLVAVFQFAAGERPAATFCFGVFHQTAQFVIFKAVGII